MLTAILLAIASASPCEDAEAALSALADDAPPSDLLPAPRVVAGTVRVRRGQHDTMRDWLTMEPKEPTQPRGQLVIARQHQADGLLKSSVMAARVAMKDRGPDELAKDAALLHVADIYFDVLGRHQEAIEYYVLLDDTPLEATAMGRRALGLVQQGASKDAKKALKSVRGWKSSTDPDVIWARHAMEITSRDEALAQLEKTRADYAALQSSADAEALGGTALRITLAPDLVALGCLIDAEKADDQAIEAHDRALQAELSWLQRRVDLAVAGVETGRLPPRSVEETKVTPPANLFESTWPQPKADE